MFIAPEEEKVQRAVDLDPAVYQAADNGMPPAGATRLTDPWAASRFVLVGALG